MTGPNPYEAPRHVDPPRPGRRREPTSFESVFALLGGVGGALVGGSVASGPGMQGLVVLGGLVGAVLAGVGGHYLVHAVFGTPADPDEAETPAEARRRKALDEIALAEELRARAEKEGDEEVVRKLAEYRAKLERKLGE